MATRAGYLSFGMTALNATRLGRLIQVASQADLSRLTRTKLGRVSDVFRGGRFRMFASWTVTRFAGLAHASELLRGLDDLMTAFAKRHEDILVTGLADFGAYILGRGNRSRENFLRRYLPVQQGTK